MNLSELYYSFSAGGTAGEKASSLLMQTHWYSVNAVFDPKSGEALPQALSAFLSKVAQPALDGSHQDRLWRITEHARPSVERLFRALNESSRREQAMLPIRSVRELDTNSFIKLSNRPGRNIREKLAGKPYLQAVRRFQSVNLPENRLLKTFVTRLAELLELRQDYLGEEEDELLPEILSWLLSDETQAIACWDNLPPNNTLLSHRDYRRIWDAWRWLQTLDADIARDFSQLEVRAQTMRLWNDYAQTYREGKFRFADMPVLFNYEVFSIRTWNSEINKVGLPISRTIRNVNISSPVCIDLTYLRPHYSCLDNRSQVLEENYLWQQWKDDKQHFDMTLFTSDAAYLHPEATSISLTDLIFANTHTPENLGRAAHAFVTKLREVFKNETLIWLIPDFLNDFELEIIRRNINALFSDAEPLPRSVAAAFAQVDYSRIQDNGYAIVVVDTIGAKTCVTKLIARFDSELRNRLPETNGYYWERCPPIITSLNDIENVEENDAQKYDIITVNGKGQWRDPIRPEAAQYIDPNFLRSDPRIGDFAFCINLSKSPSFGGIRLHALQQRAGDIPLWRDQIPELSIKVKIDGLYRRFYLVSRGTTIKPVRGLSVPIPVNEHFTLPAGRPFYQFPLYQGENADEIGFFARLDSPAFQIKTDTVCELNLTFAYGADEPYRLIFVPLDKSFLPVRATWHRNEEANIPDASAPQYPTPMTWESLRHFPDTKRGGSTDLIHQAALTVSNLNRWLDRGDDVAQTKLKNNIAGWCRFLCFSVWRDGRSISDSECPKECLDITKELINTFHHLVSLKVGEEHIISQYDIMVLFCALHKDAPSDCVKWVTEQVESGQICDPRAVGFALGDVSESWQQDIFRRLSSKPNKSAISVFAYAIWREQHFIEHFSIYEMKATSNVLTQRLAKLISVKIHDNRVNREWVRATAETLELLLGLLRSRSSTIPEIKKLLQPHQKITKELAKQVERVTEIVTEANINLFSRVQLNIPKPAGDRTPDLLYALRLYLTGDDGANAIHITSVSDNDND